MDLTTKVQFLHGVGPKMAERLNRLGVQTAKDLIYNFPRAYVDYTKIVKIGDLGTFNFEPQTIRAKIVNIANRRTSRRRFTISEAVVADDTGSIKIVWFNQSYLEKMLRVGQEIVLNGKISFDSYSNQMQMDSPTRANGPKIVPIYPETAGISSYYIQKLFVGAKNLISEIPEHLPKEILKKNDLLGIQEAILNLHQPKDSSLLSKAKARLAFDELFLFSLQKQLSKQDVLVHKAHKMEIDESFLKDFAESLPFKLTDAQRKSSWAIIKDLSGDKPMNRLLNGDVGSGKTVVAAFAAAVVIKSGFRVAIMAPTEILANQHFQTLSKVSGDHGITVGLLTSANKSDHTIPQIIVGTHALIQKKVELTNLGLVIIDEQHRFGVDQRNKLLQVKDGFRPHFLSMTATPIPRTMSLVVFADLDVSVIDEMPKDRKKIITKVVEPNKRNASYEFIRAEVKNGHQVFVICPLIEETGNTKENLFEEDRKTVVKESEKLRKEVFPELRVAMLHGKMKSKEKEGNPLLISQKQK